MLSALNGPFISGIAVTADNSNTFTQIPRGIYVGGSGDVAIRWQNGQGNTVFKAVPVGTILNIRPDVIWSTGTTATNLVILF